MIINYESIVKAIEDEILEYTSSPDYKSSKTWQNIVSGMNKTLYILDDVKRRSSYYKALSGLDRNDLHNLRNCINGKIRDIEEEEKVKLYRLSIDDICYYYSTAKSAEVLKGFNKAVSQFGYDTTPDPYSYDTEQIQQTINSLACTSPHIERRDWSRGKRKDSQKYELTDSAYNRARLFREMLR